MELVDIKTTETVGLDSYPGVEVEVRTAVSMRDFMAMQKMADIGSGDAEGVEEAVSIFGEKFIERWNVSVNGEPVQPSGETLAKMPLAFQLELTSRWFGLIRGPSGPLGSASSTPSDSPEPSTDEPGEG